MSFASDRRFPMSPYSLVTGDDLYQQQRAALGYAYPQTLCKEFGTRENCAIGAFSRARTSWGRQLGFDTCADQSTRHCIHHQFHETNWYAFCSLLDAAYLSCGLDLERALSEVLFRYGALLIYRQSRKVEFQPGVVPFRDDVGKVYS
jgi:hypothetical protein